MSRPIGNGPLIYERMRHYIAFLEQAPVDPTYLFLESDMLVLERLRLDIAEDWDVAIASKSSGMWINGGMFLVRAQRREPALAFLRQAARFYEERYLTHPNWGADQAALRDARGAEETPRKCAHRVHGNRTRSPAANVRVHTLSPLVRATVSTGHLDPTF